ncbi:hypothetical protein [Propylenella binzhouense]|nr:hypothetical protein [Propylenella binzhouense]
MLMQVRDDHALRRERALTEALREVADELRLIDVADLVAFVRFERYANIADLVNSSVELLFKPGTLRFGAAAQVEIDWRAAPAVMLDLEFRHMGVTVLFNLELRGDETAVDIHYIAFAAPDPSPEANTRRLVAALGDARLAGS